MRLVMQTHAVEVDANCPTGTALVNEVDTCCCARLDNSCAICVTGINGPPLMLLYACLQASKDAVRGTNAVMSLVQDQWIGYYVFGLLQWADRYLYLSAAVAGASGMLIGNSVQKLMDQRHFNFVMSMLMATCCTLMLCAAAGLINLASE